MIMPDGHVQTRPYTTVVTLDIYPTTERAPGFTNPYQTLWWLFCLKTSTKLYYESSISYDTVGMMGCLMRWIFLLNTLNPSNFKVTWLKKIKIGRFRTVTPVWIHRWLWNVAQSVKQQRRDVLLFSKVIHQILRSHGTKHHPFWPKLGVSGL